MIALWKNNLRFKEIYSTDAKLSVVDFFSPKRACRIGELEAI